jgi:hypothetical protein
MEVRELFVTLEDWIMGDDSVILSFLKMSLVFGIPVILLIVVIAWLASQWDAKDPHYYLNTNNWHCSHSHTVTSTVIVGGKIPAMTTSEVCDQYTMNGRDQ